MKTAITTLTILILLLFSNTTKSQKPAEVDMRRFIPIAFDDMAEDITCIKLEKSSNAYFTDCWKIVEYNNLFYLYSLSSFSVAIFDSFGKPVKRIGGSTQGVNIPNDIFINEKDKELWIIDEYIFLKRYSLRGDFKSRQKLPFSAIAVVQAANNQLLCYDGGNNKNSIYLFKLASKDRFTSLSDFVPKVGYQGMSAFAGCFALDQMAKSVYAIHDKYDTIYRYTPSTRKLTPFIHLNFGGDYLKSTDYPATGFSDKEFAQLIKKQQKAYSITGFTYAAGLLFLHPTGKKEARLMAIDIGNKRLYRFDRLFDGIRLSPPIGAQHNNLYFSASASQLLKAYAVVKNASKYKAVRELLKSLTSNDNRVIIKVKIKKLQRP